MIWEKMYCIDGCMVIRVGKTGSFGPWSRVIVFCSKLLFCQNDPPMQCNGIIILAKGKLATMPTLTFTANLVPYSFRPIHLYLIFEKSSSKNWFQWIGFSVYFEVDFYCLFSLQKSISKLIFEGQKSSSSN